MLRARLGDPAVWEAPGPELRSQVVGSGGRRRRSRGRVEAVGAGGGGSAGAAAALVIGVVAASLVLLPGRADGADWELSLYANAGVAWRGGARSTGGTPRTGPTCGSTSTASHRPVRTSTTRSGCRRPSGQHVPAGTFRESGQIEVVVGCHPGRLPADLDHARARRRRRAAHGRDDRRHARLVTDSA